MKINKKIISLITLVMLMILIPFNVYGMSINNVTDQGTPINFDEGILTKKITNIENNEVIIELNLSINNNKIISSDSEILFLIDNSSSMGTVLEDKVTTRKTKVVNSSSELIKKIHNNNSDVKMAIMSFSEEQQLVQDFTNNENTLVNACNNFAKQAPSGETNMANALNISKQKFSPNVKNKILILLTDGFPTDGDSSTKAQLQDENVYIISTLVGVENSDKEKITSIFGTEINPVADKFYDIEDNDIETTISKNIYNRILDDFQGSISNIVIKDYFPEEIIKNFDIMINQISKGETMQNSDVITWTIDSLNTGKNVSLSYTLRLKDEYDENIIEKILNTNQKVELSYTGIKRSNQSEEMLDTPQIKITTEEGVQTYNIDNNKENKSLSNKSISKKSDTTTSKSTIPYTGTNSFILIAIILGVTCSILLKRKIDSIK